MSHLNGVLTLKADFNDAPQSPISHRKCIRPFLSRGNSCLWLWLSKKILRSSVWVENKRSLMVILFTAVVSRVSFAAVLYWASESYEIAQRMALLVIFTGKWALWSGIPRNDLIKSKQRGAFPSRKFIFRSPRIIPLPPPSAISFCLITFCPSLKRIMEIFCAIH